MNGDEMREHIETGGTLMTLTASRPRISEEFLAENKRRRLLDALARRVARYTYRAVTVADIVSEAAAARNTFYEVFGSRNDAARALLTDACPDLEVKGGDLAGDSAAVLAVEIAALGRIGEEARARAALECAWDVVGKAAEFVAEPLDLADDPSDPELATLPPGRHGLDPQFVRANQRRRTLEGVAHAIYAVGYSSITIDHITRHAAVSRRTFYEHFNSKREAAHALIDLAEGGHGAPQFGLAVDSGLGSLWAEIVAAMLVGDRIGALERRRAGEEVLLHLDTEGER